MDHVAAYRRCVERFLHTANAVIASAAKQSRVRAVNSGLLRRLRLLAMTGGDSACQIDLRATLAGT
jgi:hypothetical protein